jgi:hypothetical protein
MPHEQQQLESFGWKEGDPLPSDLAQRIARAKEAEEAEENAALEDLSKSGRPPMAEPPEKSIDELPPTKQKEIGNMLRAFKEQAPLIEQARNSPDPVEVVEPGVQAALASSMRGKKIRVIDDRAPVKSADDLQARIDQAEGKGQTDAVDDNLMAEEEAPSSNLFEACPRCHWDASQGSPIEPEPTDWVRYMDNVFAGGVPFQKEYNLFGGRLVVRFRDLPTKAAELARATVAQQLRMGEIAHNEALELLAEYRLTLALIAFTAKGEMVELEAPLQEALDKGAKLGDLSRFLRGWAPFNTESVWTAVKVAYDQFNTVVNAMTLRASDPNCWCGTEG